MGREGRPQALHHDIALMAFDGGHCAAFTGHGEGDAGPNRLTVKQNDTGPTHSMFAAEMGAGETRMIPNEVREVRSGLGLALDPTTVDFNNDRDHDCSP